MTVTPNAVPAPPFASIDEPTLEHYADAWLTRRARALAPRTTAKYSDALRLHVLPHVGVMSLIAITRPLIIQVLDHQGRKGAPRSVRLTFTVMHALLADAVVAGVLAYNPAEKLAGRYPIPKDEAPYYTAIQVCAFLESAGEWADFFATMGGAGLRVGETRGLQKWDVDLTAKQIRVTRQLDRVTGEEWRPKSRKGRLVPIAASLLPVLTALATTPGVWLFPLTLGPTGYQQIRRAFRRIAADACVPVLSPKAFRHAFGSSLAADGLDLRAIQKAMGHADARTTERYAGHYPIPRSEVWDRR